MRALVLYLLLFMLFNYAYGGRNFRLGRRMYGNVGPPFGYETPQVPDPAWFPQKLDHSNPSDLRTWPQVSTIKLPNSVLVIFPLFYWWASYIMSFVLWVDKLYVYLFVFFIFKINIITMYLQHFCRHFFPTACKFVLVPE